MFATLLSPGTTLPHTLPAAAAPAQQRKAYIHLVQTSRYNPGKPDGAAVKLTGPDGASFVLREGDGAYIMGGAGATLHVANEGDRVAEIILFDLE